MLICIFPMFIRILDFFGFFFFVDLFLDIYFVFNVRFLRKLIIFIFFNLKW